MVFKKAGVCTAEFGQFNGDYGLAARRAATQLTSQLSSEIRRNEKLR